MPLQKCRVCDTFTEGCQYVVQREAPSNTTDHQRADVRLSASAAALAQVALALPEKKGGKADLLEFTHTCVLETIFTSK